MILYPSTCRFLRHAVAACAIVAWFAPAHGMRPHDWVSTVQQVQPKMVKIFGAGGLRGLPSHQTGFFVSADGLVLTVWSYVLDSDPITVVLDDGRKFDAKLKGFDPRMEVAVLQLDISDADYVDLSRAAQPPMGTPILGFSNLYGVATGNESTSVQQGVVSATTTLSAWRGSFESTYQGPVYVFDAITNNPGAAGGLVTDGTGRPIGLIGKELRNSQTGTWLNFAIPCEQLVSVVDAIVSGQLATVQPDGRSQPSEPMTLDLLGLVLVADVVDRTPPFVDRVLAGSSAEAQGFLADDLIIEVNGKLTPSHRDVIQQLQSIDRDSPVEITVQRGRQFHTFRLRASR